MTPEDREPKFAQLLRGMANRGEDDFCFAYTGFTASDTENSYRWHQVLISERRACNRDGKVWADRNKGSIWWDGTQPGKPFRRDRKDRQDCKGESAAHRADLGEPPNGIDQAGTRVGFDVMKDNAHTGTSRLQNFQRWEY